MNVIAQGLLTATLITQGYGGGLSISGRVFLQDGSTLAGPGISVAAAVNGGAISGTGVTNGSSVYTIPGIAAAASVPIAVYLQNSPPDGGTITTSTGNNLSGLDIFEGTLITRSDGGAMTNVILAAADNNDPDLGFYNVSMGALNVGFSTNLLVPAGHTFAPGGDITAGGNITLLGTFVPGTNLLFMAGVPGVLNTGSNVLYDFKIDTGSQIVLASDLVVQHDIRLGTDFFTSPGTLDVSTSNYAIAVGGSWIAIPLQGNLIAQQGTVTFNGANQSISGSTTFYNLVKQVATADTWTFQAGSFQTIFNSFTATGAPGQPLSMVSDSPGSQWRIQSPATHNVANVFVQDSDNSTGVLVNPASSVDGGHNINWFGTVVVLSVTWIEDARSLQWIEPTRPIPTWIEDARPMSWR